MATLLTTEDKSKVTRVILWCVPRSTSTAFLECMTNVPDSQMWYEPYTAWHAQSKHREASLEFNNRTWGTKSEDFTSSPGGYVVGDKSQSWIKQQLEASPPGKKLIFSKDMASGLDGLYQELPTGFRHTFLIRHPYKVFDSWKRSLNRSIRENGKEVTLDEFPTFMLPEGYFYRELYDLYVHVKENMEPNPVIIDIDDLLADPVRVLKAYCETVNIPYTDDLLQWKPGHHYMDKLWMIAKEHIYILKFGNVHKETTASTGFKQVSNAKLPDRASLPEDVLHCADVSMKYYDEMYANRLKS